VRLVALVACEHGLGDLRNQFVAVVAGRDLASVREPHPDMRWLGARCIEPCCVRQCAEMFATTRPQRDPPSLSVAHLLFRTVVKGC
jgi:hypothetical protein